MEEGKNTDYKLTIDISSEREKLELVKDIVAIANSGGGKIIFGENHAGRPGVDNAIVAVLDSARYSDQIKKYTSIKSFDLKHHVEQLSENKFVVTLTIPPSLQLIVMSREGSWKGFDNKNDRLLFNEGDIWVRHSSKTERISNEDIRMWAEGIRIEERNKILSRLTMFATLPEGFEVVSTSGTQIASPKDLLANACLRRRRDNSHLLRGDELLWIFQYREGTTYTNEELAILIASSLRRNPTLYWWLTLIEEPSQLLIAELFSAINGTDRDKSDASRSVIELASIYADEQMLREILKALRNSGYSHFREAAADWESRKAMHSSLLERIKKVKHNKKPMIELSLAELEIAATGIAAAIFSESGGSTKSLGGINRVIWYKKKRHLLE